MTEKRVLVTGGAGYIGSKLCGLLLNSGYSVILFDHFLFGRGPIKGLMDNPNLTVIEGDIRDSDLLETALKPGCDIIHLASLSNDPSCDLDPRLSTEINYNSTMRLFDIARNNGCSRFIFASSCSVYGFGGDEFLKENSLCEPVSLYAELKLKCEEALLKKADENTWPVILRQATIFGHSPRMRFDLAINQMVMQAMTRGKIYVMGGGKQWRPFLHVKDTALIFKAVLEAEKSVVYKEIFNAGSNENNFQIENLARIVKKEIGSVDIEIIPDDDDRRNYNVDFSKIKNLLGFKPGTNISEGIAEIAAFINEDINRDYTDPKYFNITTLKNVLKDVFKNNKQTVVRP